MGCDQRFSGGGGTVTAQKRYRYCAKAVPLLRKSGTVTAQRPNGAVPLLRSLEQAF